LQRTIEDILSNAEADTEVIAILDSSWPDPPVKDHPKVTVIHHATPVGPRGGVNEGARLSQAKFIMKLDGHCAVDKGFDVKLMADCEKDWTVIPRMYRLHVFDWECPSCGERYYQADPVPVCKCGGTEFKVTEVWNPRFNKRHTDFAMFNKDLQFKYWRRYEKHHKEAAKPEIADTMSSIGACFFMHRERFFELGGLDEAHGFWGQFGTEVSCKSWLSGGRQVVNKKTWFAHFFRVGKLRFPYSLSGEAQERARQYSRWFWFGNRWDKAKLPLKWLVDKFQPVPTWENYDWSQV
jgi:hypothetical protein